MNYAIFSYDNDGTTIEFPDLPGCISCAYSEESLLMSKEALELYLENMNENNIPTASKMDDLAVSGNQRLFLIKVENNTSNWFK
jgi:predicted RNase H-like HicB family nuclease